MVQALALTAALLALPTATPQPFVPTITMTVKPGEPIPRADIPQPWTPPTCITAAPCVSGPAASFYGVFRNAAMTALRRTTLYRAFADHLPESARSFLGTR